MATIQVGQEGARGRPSTPSASRWLLVYLVVATFFFGLEGVGRMFSEWDWLNDLHYFTRSANLVTSDQRQLLHDPQARMDAGLGEVEGIEAFPLPATTALIFWPLTLFEFDGARIIFLALSIAAGLGVVLIAYLWSKSPYFALLVFLAHASMLTYFEVLRFSQLAPVLSLLLCGGLIAMASGRLLLSALLTSFIAFKPSIALAPLALVALRRRPAPVILAALVAGAIVIFIPLMLIGVEGLRDYRELLSRYAEDSFRLDGTLTAGGGWMLNWHGFVSRLSVEAPSRPAVYALDVLSLLLMLVVWRKADVYLSWLAAVLATLMVIPHSVFYDWVLILGVAPFALFKHPNSLLLFLLPGLHLAINFDTFVILHSSVYDRWVFLTPVVALLTLTYLAFGPVGSKPAASLQTPVGRLTVQRERPQLTGES